MRDLHRRISKLEAAISVDQCSCRASAPCVVVIEGQPIPPSPTCPVHGESDRLVILIRKYSTDAEVAHA